MMNVSGFLKAKHHLRQTVLVIQESHPVGTIPRIDQTVLMIKCFRFLRLLRNATDLDLETMATPTMKKQLSPTFNESNVVELCAFTKIKEND